MEVVNETLSFENLTQFDEWKLEEEKKSKSCFIKNSSVKKFNDTNHWYYYCNRSGIGRFRGKGERIMKVKGSCKIGITCMHSIEDYNYDDNGDGDSDDVTDDEECALDNDDSGDDGDHSASDVNDMTMSTNNAPNDELHEQNNGAPEFNTEEYFTHILNTGCSRQSRDTHEVTNEIETLTGQLLSLYSSKLSKCRYFKGCQNSPSVRNFSSPCH
jgi:hypothetical protein